MDTPSGVILKSLTKEEIKNLKVGQELLLSTGKNDSYLSAKVVVYGEIEEIACWVKIIEILDHGTLVDFDDGDTLVATYAELSVLAEN